MAIDPSVDQPPITTQAPTQRNIQPLPTYAQIQAQQPPTPGTVDLPALYDAMQNYYQPLSQPMNLSAPQFDDATIQGLADQFLAVQQANETSIPSQESVLAKASSHLTAGEVAAQVGKQTWEQMITDPFNQFMDTWKRDPKTGLLETLGGAAIIGGIIGLEAVTMGGATPWIFAAGAALVAPGMANAWWTELRDPSDSHLVSALVNTATGVLTVGLPMKWSGGLGTARRGAEQGIRFMRDAVEPRGVAKLWLTGNRFGATLADARVDVPLGKQMDVLGDTFKQINQQFKHWQLPTDGITDTGQLLQAYSQVESWGQARKLAIEEGDVELADELWNKMEELASGKLLSLRLMVAQNHRFLPSNPFKHVPLQATIASNLVDAKTLKKIQGHLDTVLGTLGKQGDGSGFSSAEILPKETSVVDHQVWSLASGMPETAISEIGLAEKEIAGLLKISEKEPVIPAGAQADAWDRLSDYEKIYTGLEDKELWKRLTPVQKLHGQVMASMWNAVTVAQLKRGVIGLPYAGRVPRLWGAVNPEMDLAQLYRDPIQGMKGKLLNFSRTFELAMNDGGDVVKFNESRSRFDILQDEATKVESYDPAYVEFLRQHQGTITGHRRSIGGSEGYLTHARANLSPNRAKQMKQLESIARVQARIDELRGGGVKEQALAAGHDEATAQQLQEHVLMAGKDLSKAKEALPPGRKLITGSKLFRNSIAAAVFRLHVADYHEYYGGIADTNFKVIRDAVLKPGQEEAAGALLQAQEFVDKIGGKPTMLPETAFHRGGTGTIEKKAKDAGYAQIMPAIGTEGELHYRPAIYALEKTAKTLQDAYESSYSSSQLYSGVAGALFKLVSTSKHVIMLSPAWHFMNVLGRMIAFWASDPAVATNPFSIIFKRAEFLTDPRLRAQLATEFTMNGGRRGNKYNISRALHHNAREDTGQTTFPGVIRTQVGALAHAYERHAEDGFWKMVDDFQLAAYQYSKDRLKRLHPELGDAEIGQLSSLYGNDLAGMVTPAYMNKVYRHARNLMWFAPSYWATFMRSMLSVSPGADRLSSFLATARGGEFTRFSAVPMKGVSEIGRREMVRMHRQWMLTYLTTAVAAADMLNVILGGRHLWENDEGHMFDVNVDKAAEAMGATSVGKALGLQGVVKKGSSVKHAYFSGMPFFRQAVDVANAMGFGHDYGFGHQFGDQKFQEADALQKALLLGGGLLQGIKEEAATKTASPLQAGYGIVQGETLSGRARGVERKIGGPLGNFGALASFIPGGSAAQSAMTQQQPIGQALQSWGGSLLQQYTGLPSIYHLGVEQAPIDDSEMKSWVDQRSAIHDTLNNASKQMFAGQIQPIQYERLRQQSVDKMLQLNSDTFGETTPTGALSKVRLELERANGLDQNDLTDSQWAERNDIFQMEWDQALQNASPEGRAAWWEAETSQWTDADYLVWEAQQMRQTLMAAVDGQGGQHIRAYQHQIGPLLDIPSAKMRKQLEEGDPYYYAYRQILKKIASTSSLGAFINAFVSPYTHTLIEPEQLTPEAEAALADIADTGSTIIRPETARALAAQAKARAKSPAVAAAGGKASADPGFQQDLTQIVSDASSS